MQPFAAEGKIAKNPAEPGTRPIFTLLLPAKCRKAKQAVRRAVAVDTVIGVSWSHACGVWGFRGPHVDPQNSSFCKDTVRTGTQGRETSLCQRSAFLECRVLSLPLIHSVIVSKIVNKLCCLSVSGRPSQSFQKSGACLVDPKL